MRVFAYLIIILFLAVLTTLFWPIAQVEIGYFSDQIGSVKYTLEDVPYNTFVKVLRPVNTDFSIIIPKIAVIAPIIAGVDPQNEFEYLKVLKEGIAQAKDTGLPGGKGNIYLFAHSRDAFYNVAKYNTKFFLLGKLSKGDEIFIYYKGRRFKYVVDEVKVISPDEVNYSAGSPDKNTLTLQTDYPPGMLFGRLIVTADEVGMQ